MRMGLDMRTMKVKLLLALAATLALAVQSTNAGAESFGFSPAGNIALQGPLTFETSEGSISCTVTLAGTLERSLVSTASGTRFGTITEARTAACEGGSIRILIGNPLRVFRFLFNLERERLLGVLFRIEEFGVLIERLLGFQRCLFGVVAPVLLGIEHHEEGEYTVELTFLNEPPLELFRNLGASGCPPTLRILGRLRLTPQQQVIYLRR
jgi:hypothetical protein